LPNSGEPWVYLKGKMVPASQAHLAIYDAGIVLGATVTEMTRTFRHQPYRLEDHVQRLFRSLRYTRLQIEETPEKLTAISRELIQKNVAGIEAEDELGLIHFVTAGEYPVYAGSAGGAAEVTPTVCLHTFPMPWELWARKLEMGQHLVTPSIRHVPPQCYDPKMKYRSRMHYFLADQEARLVDPEASALLLDLDGNVTETSGANFLIVDEGKIVSPTLRNTLPGISRATVRELAEELGIGFEERDIQVHSVVNAEEAWTVTTPYCMAPVTRVNGIPIGNGRPGPLYRRLMEAWSKRVGVPIEAQIVEGARRRQAAREITT
jgi:branched-chain amino acid aminotransferase